ncbi:hypothetical protein ABPG77_009063 [Micractinium sp. CCAP 211/92]
MQEATWLQRLGAWWQTRQQAAAVATAGATVRGAAEVQDGVQGLASTSTAPKEHLVVMVHGLFGTRDNWKAISGLLAEHLDPDATLLFVSHCNERQRTFEGIDVCGERLAEEIRAVVAQHPGLARISLLGHSMGGLISRYAAGKLYDPGSGTLAGLAPCHFVAMATPHLGCDAQYSPAQVPLIRWVSTVPAIGGLVGSVVSELAAPVSGVALGRAGLQFFLMDGQQAPGGGSPPAQQQQPLLYRLSRDEPESGLHFLSALSAFETRTLYANSSGDHLVGWANSSLRRLEELPRKDGSGAGVVREDPLELAWTPAARPRLRATAAGSELGSGDGHRAGEAAVLAAESAEQLAQSGAVEGLDGRGTGASAPPERRLQQTSADVAAEEGAREQQPASAEAARPRGSSSTAGARMGLLQSSLSGSRGGSGGAGEAGSGPQAGGDAERERQLEEVLSRLQALPWRRVDVCFGATLLPLLSHQHIQMQRWWLNWPGHGVIKHLALQLEAMERLRRQAGQRQQTAPQLAGAGSSGSGGGPQAG